MHAIAFGVKRGWGSVGERCFAVVEFAAEGVRGHWLGGAAAR